MEEDYLPSGKDLKKKFQEWFRDPVPADLPFPNDANFSNRESVSTDLPFPGYLYRSYQNTRRSKYDLQKLLELLSFGFVGAVLLGASVGLIILMMNISFLGLYGIGWPNQFFVIFLAVAIGFVGGLFKGSLEKLREKYSYKDGV